MIRGVKKEKYNSVYQVYIALYILSATYCIQKKDHIITDAVLLREVTAGFEPAMTVLQTGALPLGYVTIYYTKKLPE